MTNRQLALLFISMAVNFTVALGVLPFLPLYATDTLGVDPGQTGIFLSIISIALTAGAIVGGWLSNKFHRRKLLILISSVTGLFSFWLLAYTTEIWQLTILASITWLSIGIGSTMVRIIGGILADEAERGRIFGIIGAATPFAALIGGAISGPIVDRWDIPTLFMIMSSAFIIQFLIALFINDAPAQDHQDTATDSNSDVKLSQSFWILTIASIIIFTAMSAMLMGRPLLMNILKFDATAISTVTIPGGLISLPLTFYIGTLSDRFGRKTLLLLCYVIATIGMMMLIYSDVIWHFWVSEICFAFVGISIVVGSALITDIVPREAFDTAISRYSASAWMGSIFGFGLVGYIIDWVGISVMFGFATVLMVFALVMIVLIPLPKVKVG